MVPTLSARASASERRTSFAAESRIRAQARLTWAVGWFAPGLLVYVSVEPALLSLVPAAWYWPLRLLPDVLISFLAGASILSAGRRQPSPYVLALSVLTIVFVISAADVIRGDSPTTTINAFRVVVRYLLLGLLFLNAARQRPSIVDRLLAAVAIACAIQLVAAGAQALSWIARGGSVLAIPALDGLTGRYDRLGLLLLAGILVALGRRRPWSPRLGAAVAISLVTLLLSTSRQAEIALAAGCVVLAILPGPPLRARAPAALVGAIALALIVITPARITVASVDEGPEPPAPASVEVVPVPPPLPSNPAQTKGATQLSIDPNRNFRLYLLLSLAPWAASQEPILGFGPGQQSAVHPDPRLAAKVSADGTTWTWARTFMNDSTYASWIIQFGFVAPFLLLMVVAVFFGRLVVATWRLRHQPAVVPRIGAAITVAMVTAAAFGPVLETRVSSVAFWLFLCGALAVVGQREEQVATG